MKARTPPRLLDQHRAELALCRRCGTGAGAARPIVSLARRPRVMLVGQAPGQVEVNGGRPFSGRAGKTLFRWLERAGIDEDAARDAFYIAAITRCYPGPSPSGRGDRVPSSRERANCASWLDAELGIIQPDLIITVGRLAVDRFLGGAPLDRLVGRLHRVEVGNRSVAVIPLPHPSGASSWTSASANRALLDQGLELLGRELRALNVVDHPVRRSA